MLSEADSARHIKSITLVGKIMTDQLTADEPFRKIGIRRKHDAGAASAQSGDLARDQMVRCQEVSFNGELALRATSFRQISQQLMQTSPDLLECTLSASRSRDCPLLRLDPRGREVSHPFFTRTFTVLAGDEVCDQAEGVAGRRDAAHEGRVEYVEGINFDHAERKLLVVRTQQMVPSRRQG